eukprot:CAMPEP_0119308824 /NCGR_PEP_ID=MMETSP1333-20130426/12789_1 /TAXON_ID=418940 /ORGANISM="Scyphosphaera apsteinii, Strain RCC1455" /LENGTH=183 /DNA_ID=CAMNT_0007312683 /DNA_START=127 /DNA_END=678 /DNA_ORIENTATION=+
MQNDFMHCNGACAKMGFPDAGTPILPAVNQLIDAAHQGPNKIPVVWICADYSPEVVGPAFGAKMMCFPEAVCTTQWGKKIIEQLNPATDDIFITKSCYDGFHDTELAEILRAKGVDTVVVTGILTTVCVESTARAAVFEGFHTVIAEDAVGDTPNATKAFLERFNTFFGDVQKSQVICQRWTH